MNCLVEVFKNRKMVNHLEVVGNFDYLHLLVLELICSWEIRVADAGDSLPPHANVQKIYLPKYEDRLEILPSIVSYLVFKRLPLSGRQSAAPIKVSGDFVLFLARYRGWKNFNELKFFLHQSISKTRSGTISLREALINSRSLFTQEPRSDAKSEITQTADFKTLVPYLDCDLDPWVRVLPDSSSAKLVELYLGYEPDDHKAGSEALPNWRAFSIEQVGQVLQNVMRFDAEDIDSKLIQNEPEDIELYLKSIDTLSTAEVSHDRCATDDISRLIDSLSWHGINLKIDAADDVYQRHLVSAGILYGQAHVGVPLSTSVNDQDEGHLPALRLVKNSRQIFIDDRQVITTPRSYKVFNAL